MTSLSAVASSGMAAAQAAMQVSARNIANLAVTVQPAADGADPAAASFDPVASSRGSVEKDLVGLLLAKNVFLANMAVFRTGQELSGALLDVRS